MACYCSDDDFLRTNIGDIHVSILNSLLKILDSNDLWKQLVAVLPPLLCSKISVDKLEREGRKISGSSANLLLQELSSFGVTVSDLVSWCEELKLENALLLIKPDEQLRIVEQPTSDSKIKVAGPLSFTLRCVATGFPTPLYQWMKNDIDLVYEDKQVLTINPITLNDAGVYQCRVYKYNRITDKEEIIYSEKVHIEVKPGSEIHPSIQGFTMNPEKPVIIVQPVCPSAGKISQGSEVLLRCEGRSRQKVYYQWYRDGQELLGENCEDLKLSNLYPSEGKTQWGYQCVVYNELGNVISNPVNIELDYTTEETQYVAEDKVALLIANQNYQHLESLKLPAFDVRTVAKLLSEMDFRVYSFLDLELVEMRNVVDLFCRQLRKGVYGVFFYGGHGFQQFGQCYLQPVDATKMYLYNECLCAEYVLQCMQEKDPALSCILLDSCRTLPLRNMVNNNVLPPSIIYQPKMDRNVVFAYSTSFGCSAHDVIGQENGPFVQLLSKHLTEKRSIQDILMTVQEEMEFNDVVGFRQFPWTGGNLSRKLSLCDPVISKSADYMDLIQEWKSLAVIPSAREVNCKEVHLKLEFDRHLQTFWNAMDVYIFEQKLSDVRYLFRFQNREVLSKMKRNSAGIIMVEVFNLQRLKGELRGILLCEDNKAKTAICTIPLELGFPLVAKKFLWLNGLNMDLDSDAFNAEIVNLCLS